MSDFDTPGTAVDEPVKRPTASSRFADLGDRLARTFGSLDRTDTERLGWGSPPDARDQAVTETEPVWGPGEPRFPLSRQGYDREYVDDHIADLERELAELRTQRSLASPINVEIERIGEQATAVLRVAHEEAQKTMCRAQVSAERCVADAESAAAKLTDEANRRLRTLDGDTDVVWRERDRLIQDVRDVSAALVSLADAAAERFPAEPEKITAPTPVAEKITAPAPVDGQPVDGQPVDETEESQPSEPEVS
jgi:cell division septum initiation protein DivIVA